MALGGESRKSERPSPLAGRAVFAGPAHALALAIAASGSQAPSLEPIGAVLIGPSDAELPVPIIGRSLDWETLDRTIDLTDAQVLILAEPPGSRAALRALLLAAGEKRRRVMVFKDGVLRAMTVDDVIGRPIGDIDWARIRTLVAGSRILITGGGGSIGGELARRVASLGPARLCVLDSSELNIFNIGREAPSAALALADVRDAQAVRRWFERTRPDVVFHAAALKQVPLVEAHASEGVLTNVIGCRNAADAAAAIGAHFIFVSTDKAVNPSGLMGATKRMAEMYCQALDREQAARGGPRFITVRLGNVLGSAGSVAPLFDRQLAAGGPLTVTDPDMTRYFISIPQAADFLLQAAAVGANSEVGRGAAFVLDMGDALPVVDLARKMIRLQGLRPEVDIGITMVGLRPGEKLQEQLIAEDEWREPDLAPGVMAAASPPRGLADLNETIEKLGMLARAGADGDVAATLRAAVAPLPRAEEGGDAEKRVKRAVIAG